MKLPPGFTEDEVVKIIDSIVNQLASQFRFGYYDPEDLKQYGRQKALESLHKFNPTKSNKGDNTSNQKLFCFLQTVVRSRLINLKRDKYCRTEVPCTNCPFYDPKNKKSKNQCAAFLDKMECDKWSLWCKNQKAKQNLSDTVDIHAIDPNGEKNTEYSIDTNDLVFKSELMSFIDKELPACYRSDYARLLQGSRIPKVRLDKLKEVVKEIIERFGDVND